MRASIEEAVVPFRLRSRAGLHGSEPSLPVAHDEVVQAVPYWSRYDPEQRERGPRIPQPGDDPQDGVGSLEALPVVQEDEAVGGTAMPLVRAEEPHSRRGVERRKSKPRSYVPPDHEPHGAVAQVAHAVEQDDRTIRSIAVHKMSVHGR